MSEVESVVRICRGDISRIPLSRLMLLLLRTRQPQTLAFTLLLARKPRQSRLTTAVEILALHPRFRFLAKSRLFSPSFYLAAYPDVAASGANPWLHYQAFGRREGRLPHPLIDPDWLSWSLEVTRSNAVEHYFQLPTAWRYSPSPYLNLDGYLAASAWDGKTHPFVQLLSDHEEPEWTEGHLRTIDLLSVTEPTHEIIAGAMSGLPFHADIERYPLEEKTECVITTADVTIAAGVCVVMDGKANSCGEFATSADQTMVRHATEVFLVRPQISQSAESLFLLPDLIDRDSLLQQVPTNRRVFVSPRTENQHRALQSWLHYDLPEAILLPWREVRRLVVSSVKVLTPEGFNNQQAQQFAENGARANSRTAIRPAPSEIEYVRNNADLVLTSPEDADFWRLALRSGVAVEVVT